MEGFSVNELLLYCDKVFDKLSIPSLIKMMYETTSRLGGNCVNMFKHADDLSAKSSVRPVYAFSILKTD